MAKNGELLKLVQAAMAREQLFVTAFKAGARREHPQTLVVLRHAEGRLESLRAVELALRGNPLLLQIMAGIDKEHE